MSNTNDNNIPLEFSRLRLNERDDIVDHPTPPVVFDQDELHLYDHDIVLQNENGVQRNGRVTPTPGSEALKGRVENSLAGYNASTKKRLFVFDHVIVPLLNEGRAFYVRRDNFYELMDLTDDNTKREITKRVIKDMRDSNKRLRASTQH